ncbi:hypothetical protein ABZP36_021843 [Zizania latifolia]
MIMCATSPRHNDQKNSIFPNKNSLTVKLITNANSISTCPYACQPQTCQILYSSLIHPYRAQATTKRTPHAHMPSNQRHPKAHDDQLQKRDTRIAAEHARTTRKSQQQLLLVC